MATFKVPANCTSITFQGSGTKTPDSDGIVTANNTTDFAAIAGNQNQWGPGSTPYQKTKANGSVNLFLPARITSMTLGGTAYTTANSDGYNVLTNVDPVDAANAIASMKDQFPCALVRLVTP